MKKLLRGSAIASLGVFIVIGVLFYLQLSTFLFLDYEEDEFLYSIINGDKKISFYLKSGGSLNGDSVLGVYEKGNKKRIIVFAYPTHNIDAEWIDRDTLRIKWKNSYTGKVIIKNFDVNKEHYDWREEN